jgi:hypothetical protein
MASRRFTCLTYGFSKRADYHLSAVGLFVAHFNFCKKRIASRERWRSGSDHLWKSGNG